MSEVLYEVWLQDDRGEFGDLRRMDDGTWTVRPAWLTGWLPDCSVRSLREAALADQQYAADMWDMWDMWNDDEYLRYPDDDRRDDQRVLRNLYYMARWWYDAYSHALRWERQHGN